MPTTKISDRDRAIISLLAGQADRPLTEVADSLDVPAHTVRYTINQLQDQGLIWCFPLVNMFALGIGQYLVYMKLVPEYRSRIEALLDWLRSNESVSWVAQLGGEYDLCVTVLARSTFGASAFFDALTEDIGDCVLQKNVVSPSSFTFYPAHFWHTSPESSPEIHFSASKDAVTIDDTDARILRAVSNGLSSSRRELARSLNLASSTLDARIRNLTLRGVLSPPLFLINSPAFGIQPYKVLVHVKGFSTEMRNAVRKLCRATPFVTTVITTIGGWDFEIGIEVTSHEIAHRFLDRLRTELRGGISQMDLIQHYRDYKITPYPFVASATELSAAGGG